MYDKEDKTNCNKNKRIPLLPTTYRNLSNEILQMKLLGIMRVDADVIDQLFVGYSAFINYWSGNWNRMQQCIDYL
jgi:hypothetical protein